MAADETKRPGFSLRRWSQRKLEASQATTARTQQRPPSTPVSGAPAPTATPATPASVSPSANGRADGAGASAKDLPPPESLTFDSDFTVFMQPKVDDALKRQALKKLFGDPRFNVMDGLDVYVDDYSKPDPLPQGMIEQLVQGRYVFDPPRTRVNEQGFVEDAPPDGAASAALPAGLHPAGADTAAGEPVDGKVFPQVRPQPDSTDDAPGDGPTDPTTDSAMPPKPEPTSR